MTTGEQTIEINGQTQSLYDWFGGDAFFQAVRNGYIDWSSSSLSFGVDEDGKGSVNVAIAVRGRDGLVLARFTAAYDSDRKSFRASLSPDLANAAV